MTESEEYENYQFFLPGRATKKNKNKSGKRGGKSVTKTKTHNTPSPKRNKTNQYKYLIYQLTYSPQPKSIFLSKGLSFCPTSKYN